MPAARPRARWSVCNCWGSIRTGWRKTPHERLLWAHLNCGCPSKLVNGSGGGATLLKDPDLIYRAAKAMRASVPASLPVTVKVRLGWDSSARSMEIADAVQQAGASELVVHGRTKEDGYRAEAINWQAIGDIRQRLRIPVIANGEI